MTTSAKVRGTKANKALHLTEAGMTVFRDIKFLAADPASERSRLAHYYFGPSTFPNASNCPSMASAVGSPPWTQRP